MKKEISKVISSFLIIIMMFSVFPVQEIVLAVEDTIEQQQMQLKIPKNDDELQEVLNRKITNLEESEISTYSIASNYSLMTTGATFYIRNKTSGKYLTATNVVDQDHVNVGQWQFAASSDQKWQFIDDGNGYYKIQSLWNSSMALDVKANLTSNGTELQIYPIGDYPSQKFKFIPLPDGSYQILSGLTQDQRSVSNDTSSTESGNTNIHIWDAALPDETAIHNQSWYLEPVNEESEISDAPLDGEVYQIRSRRSGQIWGMAEGGTADGTVVYQMFPKQINSQFFQLKEIENEPGYFYISPKNTSDKVLQLSNKMAGDFHRIESSVLTGNDIQKFKITKNSNGTYKISPKTLSSYAMQMVWGEYENEISVLAAPYTEEENQQWIFDLTGELSAEPEEGSFYYIRARHSGQIWGLAENSEADGTVIWQMYQKHWNGQIFSFKPVADDPGYFYICPGNRANKVMQLSDKMVLDYHRIESAALSGEDKQKYKIVQNTNGSYRIVPKLYPNDAMEVAWASQETEISVIHTPYEEKSSQQWIFDEAFDPTKLKIESAKAAVFEDQNVVAIENESQMTAQFNGVSLLYNPSTHRVGGLLNFRDGDSTFSYYLIMDLAQSHLDLTGNRSIIGSREMGKINGYKLTCFRIEENCKSLTLMPSNNNLKGKTLISIGILEEATNKIFYLQSEITDKEFDYLYYNAWSRENEKGFTEVNANFEANILQSASSDEKEADKAIIKEREYLSLKRKSTDQTSSSDLALNPGSQSRRSSTAPLESLMENGSQDIPPTPKASEEGYTSMRDLLDHLRTNRSYSINDPLVSGLVREHFMYPTPYNWFGYWKGFSSSDSIADQQNPYFYARYSVILAGTTNYVTSIILVDIRSILYNGENGSNNDIGIQVRSNMDISFDSTSKTIYVLQPKTGNAKISSLALIQRITNKAGEFSSGMTSIQRTQDSWGAIASMFTMLGMLPKGTDDILDSLTSAYSMLSRFKTLYSVFIGGGRTNSPVISLDSHVIGARFGGLAKPNDDVINPGMPGSGDYAILEGTLDRSGYYEFRYYFTIEVAIAAFDRYEHT